MTHILNNSLVKNVGKILIGISFLYYVNSLVGFSLDFKDYTEKNSITNIFLALLLFNTSFLLKFQRLAIIIRSFEKDESKSSMRKLFSVHVISSSLALILPFKLGDVARVVLLSKCSKSYDYNLPIITVIAERLLDVIVIISMIFLIGTIYNYLDVVDGLQIEKRILFISFLIIATVVAIYTIKFWHGILTKNNFISLPVTAIFIENILYIVSLFRHLFHSSGSILLIFTMTIWLLEASAFTLIYIYIDAEISLTMFLALVSFIAFALPAGPIGYGAIHLVLYYALETGLLSSNYVNDGIYYSIYVYIPALVCLALLAYLGKKIGKMHDE